MAETDAQGAGGPWDAIVLAGGRSERLGGVDKALLVIGGSTLLQLSLDAVAGAGRVVVVGDRAGLSGERIAVVREDPPGGGPAAAIGAGLAGISAPVTVVVACDMPRLALVVPLLLDALSAAPASVQCVIARDGDRLQYLASAHRTAALHEQAVGLAPLTGRSVRGLYSRLEQQIVDVPAGSTHDIDSWPDADRAGVTR